MANTIYNLEMTGAEVKNLLTSESSYYGTCDTDAATAQKVVTLINPHNQNTFTLREGVTIHVRFKYSNTAQNPKLNVADTEAKSIYFNTGVLTTTNLNKGGYTSSNGTYTRVTTYIYDGTNWVWQSWGTDNDTTYSSLAPVNGGTNVSLVTTGEKYNWNSKAAGDHTHDITLVSGGTSTVDLAANTAYTLTAGGKSIIFKTPVDNNTDTKVNVTLATTTKAYLLGTSTTPTSTATAVTSLADTGVYLGTTAGSLYATNIYASSDMRLKENIKATEIDCSNVIDKLQIKEFNFKADKDKKVVVGAIAQELKEVLPEKYQAALVSGSEEEYYSINEGKLLYITIGALKEEMQKTKSLEDRLAKLEKLLEV